MRAVHPDQGVPGQPRGLGPAAAVGVQQHDLVRLVEPQGEVTGHRHELDAGCGLGDGVVQLAVELVQPDGSVPAVRPGRRQHPPVGRHLDTVRVTERRGDDRGEADQLRGLVERHPGSGGRGRRGSRGTRPGILPDDDAREPEPVGHRRAHRRCGEQGQQHRGHRHRRTPSVPPCRLGEPGRRPPQTARGRRGQVGQPVQDGDRQVGPHRGPRQVAAEGDEVGDERVVPGVSCHAAPPSVDRPRRPLPSTRRRGVSESSACDSCVSARCSRDFTVPRGQPSTVAVSASSSSSRYRQVTTWRCGSESRASPPTSSARCSRSRTVAPGPRRPSPRAAAARSAARTTARGPPGGRPPGAGSGSRSRRSAAARAGTPPPRGTGRARRTP